MCNLTSRRNHCPKCGRKNAEVSRRLLPAAEALYACGITEIGVALDSLQIYDDNGGLTLVTINLEFRKNYNPRIWDGLEALGYKYQTFRLEGGAEYSRLILVDAAFPALKCEADLAARHEIRHAVKCLEKWITEEFHTASAAYILAGLI